MTWLTNAWGNLPTATLSSGFRKLAIPTDNREVPVTDPVLHEFVVVGLVDKLEYLRVAEEVGEDLGLESSF
ncbi:hypothetical protein PI124_g11110 [Phytophthora idaei]|nr:hypothetical protein PI125_g11832 [Phytophthora idaei]KAG3154884.1 hypothetical protein PI126_g9409 [Phytophthora idaei]KAG3244092.1 hypothetical protein PI124_g11110 [Phytophthora idaei]